MTLEEKLEEIVAEKRRVYTEKNAELDDFAEHGSMMDYAEYLNQLDDLHDAVVSAFSELKLAEMRMITAKRNMEIRGCLLDTIKELEAAKNRFYEQSRWYY
jgi:formate dehydrogenase maturation protein FdhE